MLTAQRQINSLTSGWGSWLDGIEDTGVKPGFMKIGIDEIKGSSDRLSPIDEKLVRASARASRRTNLAVTCHTGGGPAGLTATKIFIEERADPGRVIVARFLSICAGDQ
jgi:predicted metal-dependent phosphotriesterase family hydrolase